MTGTLPDPFKITGPTCISLVLGAIVMCFHIATELLIIWLVS